MLQNILFIHQKILKKIPHFPQQLFFNIDNNTYVYWPLNQN